jgi:hypothetical protein
MQMIGCDAPMLTIGTEVDIDGPSDFMRQLRNTLSSPHFWDRKLRIALLTLVTFMSLC